MNTIRQHSREEFTSDKTVEHIKLGTLQRIADATEAMAKNHVQLMADCDRYKRWYDEKDAECKRLTASLNATKGYVTRLKREAHAALHPTQPASDANDQGGGASHG